MTDIVNMSLDELYDLADTLNDIFLLARRYRLDVVDMATLSHMIVDVDARIMRIEGENEKAMNREYEKEALL